VSNDLEDYQLARLILTRFRGPRAFIPTIKDLEPQLFDQLRQEQKRGSFQTLSQVKLLKARLFVSLGVGSLA